MDHKDIIIGILAVALLATIGYFLASGTDSYDKKYHPYDETLPEGGAHDRDGGERYDRKKRGDDKNCSDFKTQAEAQAFFEESGGPDSDLHKLDRDKDGRVCETLP